MPHAYPRPGSNERTSDTRALEAAIIITTGTDGKNHSLLYPNVGVIRSEHDLNRIASRETKWRKQLTQLISKSSLVVDVHSFPLLAFGKMPAASSGGGWKVVILNEYRNLPEHISIIYTEIRKIIAEVTILSGIKNDINDEAIAAGKKAILLEFCEDREYFSDDELEKVCWAIASVLSKISDGSK